MLKALAIAGPIFAFWEDTGLGFIISAGEKINLPIEDNTGRMLIGSWNGRRFLAFRDDILRSIIPVEPVSNLQPGQVIFAAKVKSHRP
jgi:hypothetical protein